MSSQAGPVLSRSPVQEGDNPQTKSGSGSGQGIQRPWANPTIFFFLDLVQGKFLVVQGSSGASFLDGTRHDQETDLHRH